MAEIEVEATVPAVDAGTNMYQASGNSSDDNAKAVLEVLTNRRA